MMAAAATGGLHIMVLEGFHPQTLDVVNLGRLLLPWLADALSALPR